MKKKLFLWPISLFLAITVLINLYSVLKADVDYSSFENRTMAYLPGPQVSSVMSGEWFSDFETYHLDQMAFRNVLIQGNSKIQRLLGKKIIGDVAVGKNHYLLKTQEDFTEKALQKSEKSIQRQLDTLKLIKQYTDQYGGQLYYLDIPSQGDFLWENYPYLQEERHIHSDETRIRRCETYQAAGVKVIQSLEALEEHRAEQLYYHTDHHYTFLGAYYVYQEMLREIQQNNQEMSFVYPAWDEMQQVSSDKTFMGSYLREIGDMQYAKYDTFEYALPLDMPLYWRYESEEESDMPLVRNADDFDYTEYGYFMNGDNANTVIRTDRPELPSIMIIGYSFTNPLELMAIYNFDEMHSIDPRHYEGSICQYIEEHPCDIVVVVDNDIYEGNAQDIATFKE